MTLYEYTIAQMVVLNQERIVIDERHYECEVLMPTKLLADIICHDLKDMGERLQVTVRPDCIVFEGPCYFQQFITFVKYKPIHILANNIFS
jgi:hypothetical protein